MKIQNIDNKLFINEQEFVGYKIIKELKPGANGLVFVVFNESLKRSEVLKIWLTQRDNDKRDKIKQGLLEAQKLAKVDGNNSVTIFSAKIFNDVLVATMEYFESETLEDFIRGKGQILICQVLRIYLNAIEETSTPDTFHGDAHDKNVLVRIKQTKHDKEIELKLCDYGTSIFSGKESSFERHWKKVKETINKCTKDMTGYQDAQLLLNSFENNTSSTLNKIKKEIKAGQFEHYDPRIFTAPYSDYLEYLEFAAEPNVT